jgi:hypothetical protein
MQGMKSAETMAKMQLLLHESAPLPLTAMFSLGEIAGTSFEYGDACVEGAHSDSESLHAILTKAVPSHVIAAGAFTAVLILPSALMASYRASDYAPLGESAPDYGLSALEDVDDADEHIEIVGADALGRVLTRRGRVRRNDDGFPLACNFEDEDFGGYEPSASLMAALDLSLRYRSLN